MKIKKFKVLSHILIHVILFSKTFTLGNIPDFLSYFPLLLQQGYSKKRLF